MIPNRDVPRPCGAGRRLTGLVLLVTVGTLGACQSPPPTRAADVGETRPGSGILNGYLDRRQLPDSLALLPRPPAPGSAQAAADLDIHKATRALRGTPRWQLAVEDNELKFPAAAVAFACALDLDISEQATPHLNMLMRRTLTDAGLATYRAKDSHNRRRPFAELGETMCVPHEEPRLAKDGSYPSGHAALGWAWGLALASLAPERTDALVQRAHAFGQSRVICGAHWQSDVEAGRLVGAAALARLQSEPSFRAQADLARQEIAAARAAGRKSMRNCAAEAAALKAS